MIEHHALQTHLNRRRVRTGSLTSTNVHTSGGKYLSIISGSFSGSETRDKPLINLLISDVVTAIVLKNRGWL